jgi:exosortase
MKIPLPAPTRAFTPLHWSLLALLGGSLCWAYWPTWSVMVQNWTHNPQYSHGYLVPVFALAILWVRRTELQGSPLQPAWWGVLLVVVGVVLRLTSAYVYFEWFDNISLLPLLAGLAVLLGGRQALAWSWPAIAFLIFMLRLPYSLETALAFPLRRTATLTSTYFLQTLGMPAVAEGNVIRINDFTIGVVEACSGLSMLMVFFALSTAVAIVIRRTLWEKAVLLLSAIPIAILANVIRITVTGFLHVTVSSAAANSFFHDFAGWLMMPLALGFLWLELWLLGRLFLDIESMPPVQTAIA